MQSILQLTEGEFDGKSVRTTSETPRRVSVIGVVSGAACARSVWQNLIRKRWNTFHFISLVDKASAKLRLQPTKLCAGLSERFCVLQECLSKKKSSALRLIVIDIDLEMKKITEEEIVQDLCRAFSAFGPKKQFVVGRYRIDLYLTKSRVAIECDEHGHRRYDQLRERQRQAFVQGQLDCSFVRFDPYASNFSIMDVIASIVEKLLV